MQKARFDSFLPLTLQSVSPQPVSGPRPVCPCLLIPSVAPAIISCTRAHLTGCHPTAGRDREVRTSTGVRRVLGRSTACGRRGANEETAWKMGWIEKLRCCCISGRFWVGLCIQNVLRVCQSAFHCFVHSYCMIFHDGHQSLRTVGAARRCRRPEGSTRPAWTPRP